jgi:hypothetical protein
MISTPGALSLEAWRHPDAWLDLEPAVIADLEIDRFDEIEGVALPQICLDSPPIDIEFTGGSAGAAAISLGTTRLYAAAVRGRPGHAAAELSCAR